ncbi:MAG: type I 3-dehydroquinate dehydratase [Salinirussus sp.]
MDFDTFVLAAPTADPGAVGGIDRADAIEFRMDLATDPLAALDAYDGDLPVIATNRVAGEGGEAPASPDRLDALAAAAEHDAVAAVDVELVALEDGSANRVLRQVRDSGCAVVVSAHDFEGTPPRNRLEELLAAACDRGAVGKLAVRAADPDDVLDLLAATRAATVRGRTVATMAMGEAGRHSRAVAPLYGSRIGYAPPDPAAATAPGQYDLATLDDLLASLGLDRGTED